MQNELQIDHSLEPSVSGLLGNALCRESIIGETCRFTIVGSGLATLVAVGSAPPGSAPVAHGDSVTFDHAGDYQVVARSGVLSFSTTIRVAHHELLELPQLKFFRGAPGADLRPMRERRLVVRNWIREVSPEVLVATTPTRPAPLGVHWTQFGGG